MRGYIMRERGARSVCGYGLETVALAARHGSPHRVKLAGCVPFVYHGSRRYGLLKPEKEILHHDTVLEMSRPHSLDFHGVLYRLAERDRRGSHCESDSVRNAVQDS